jgi:hypothetical protein
VKHPVSLGGLLDILRYPVPVGASTGLILLGGDFAADESTELRLETWRFSTS